MNSESIQVLRDVPIEDTIEFILRQSMGLTLAEEFPKGMKDTPRRILNTWPEKFSGYRWSPEHIKGMMTMFAEERKFDELVLIRDIEFHSTCEHHAMDFSGFADMAYIPNGPIVGASKLPRLLDIYARRYQVQERIGIQAVEDMMEYLKPAGAAVILRAQHSCMRCRGVMKQNSTMVTHAIRGCFKEPATDSLRELMFALNRS